MATHPYISGAGNIAQMISNLRKYFPPTVDAQTVKRFGLAPKNESYVINALQFIGLIDENNKPTSVGKSVMAQHNDDEFKLEFAQLVKEAYRDLFDLHGDGAWGLDKDGLITFFRQADKTSDAIGNRQASVFITFRELAGFGDSTIVRKPLTPKKTISTKTAVKPAPSIDNVTHLKRSDESASDINLSVRIEINLPSGGTEETYDAIFKSIKANLLS